MTEWIELYRAFVPRTKILNDNGGQHYRTMQGKLNWLENQYQAWKDEDPSMNSMIGHFSPKNVQEIHELFVDKEVDIRLEVWRPTNRRFDPHNYSKTFKPMIDALVADGYIDDDSWAYINSTTFVGGGFDAWHRSYQSRIVDKDSETFYKDKKGYELLDDGLPREMSADWWREFTDDLGEIFVRVLFKPVEKL